MKAFGIGCLHFGISDDINKKSITIQEYIQEVKKVLTKFSTTSEIDIFFDDEIKNEKISTESPNPKLQDGDECYPNIEMYQLEFKIYIPFRIQAEIIGMEEEYLDTYTENFRV